MATDNVVPFQNAARAPSAGRRLIPGRLRDARRAARMTQEELGLRSDVTRQSISAYEAGSKVPDPITFNQIVEALGQPAAYFTSENRETFGVTSPRFFRKVGPETLRRHEACSVLGEWFAQTAYYLDSFINYPKVNLPDVVAADPSGRYSDEEIEAAAELTRKQWGLGLGPISNVVTLVEKSGVVTCHYEMTGEKVDAFSFWNGARPFIFMASEKDAGVRRRFDVAHEAAHLILHRWIEAEELLNPKTLKAIEAEADRFAGALLMPRKSFPNEVYTARLDAFLDLKLRWRVSIQAMVYRCKNLDLIDDNQFTNLYKQISFRKWRSKEPMDDPDIIRIEQSRMLGQCMELVMSAGKKHPDEVCADIALSPSLIAAFCNMPVSAFVPPDIDHSAPEGGPSLK